MSISYFDVTVPVFIKSLENLKQFLQKGITHASENGVTEADYLAMRLAPDMFPLSKQIQVATDNAKGAVSRLSGVAPLTIEDTETTGAELMARIDTVIDYVRGITPEQLTEAGTSTVALPYFGGKYFTGHDYLVEFALPNFFFHVNMAYAIIRASGVPLVKGDYIGSLTLHDPA